MLRLLERIRYDAKANKQAGLRLKNKVIQYSQKYKEASDVLAIRNMEKFTLEKEKHEPEKAKKELERQNEELVQNKEDLEAKVAKMTEVTDFWRERGA